MKLLWDDEFKKSAEMVEGMRKDMQVVWNQLHQIKELIHELRSEVTVAVAKKPKETDLPVYSLTGALELHHPYLSLSIPEKDRREASDRMQAYRNMQDMRLRDMEKQKEKIKLEALEEFERMKDMYKTYVDLKLQTSVESPSACESRAENPPTHPS